MIIECPTCNARYRLDEAKIKGKGARVRCRRCGDAIMVLKPEIPESAAPPAIGGENLDLRSVVRQTLRDEPSSASSFAPPPEPPSSAPPAAETERPWTFSPADNRPSVEPAPPGTLPAETPSAETAPAGPAAAGTEPVETPPVETSPGETPPFGASPVETSLSETPPAETPPAETPPAETSSPGTPAGAPPEDSEPAPPEPPSLKDEVDVAFQQFLASARIEPPAAPAEREEPPPDLGVPAGDLRSGTAAEPAKEKPAGEPRPDFLISDTEAIDIIKTAYAKVEKGEKFDVSRALSHEPSAPQAEAAGDSLLSAPLREQAPVSTPGMYEPPPADEGKAPPQENAFSKIVPRPKPAESAKASSPFLRPSVVVLVLLFLLLAGGGGYLGFTKGGQERLRRLIPGMESLWLRSGSRPGPQYDVRNLIGYYEMNAKAGNLFVIKGQVTNAGRMRRSGIRIHAALLDAKDKTVMEKTSYAGNILSGEALRTSPREKIEEALGNRFGERLVNMDIAPGKSIPFMVVFYDPPEGMSAYRLEAKDGE